MHHMRLYRHIKAEYACTACGRVRTVVERAFSPLDGFVVLLSALPVATVAMRSPWSLGIYAIIPALAAELLALFAAGLITSLILLFDRRGTIVCRKCGGRMFFAGAHFDPAGDKAPHYTDFVIFGIFAMLNLVLWGLYLGCRLTV